MKDLTRIEFIDRASAVMRARKIFVGSEVTKKLDVAFTLYQKVLADRDRELVLNTLSWGSRTPTFIDFHFERPNCPNCSKPLYLRGITTPEGPGNVYGYKTQLICDSCLYEKYSTKDINQALDELIPKRRAYARVQENVSRGSEEGS